jgi:hypothetical protein
VSYAILGRTVTMPLVVRDATAATVIYDVPLAAAAELAPRGFAVVESAPGQAQIAIALVHYRDCDLDSYHEVGTSLFVRPADSADAPAGTFITHLPVDQEFTCAAGNQVWGFPKTVERITVDTSADVSRWVLEMDGELVLDLTVPRGGAEVLAPTPLTAYTLLGGVPHETAFTQGGSGASMRFDGAGVSLRLGDHPIAKELAYLGLPDAPVVLSLWMEHMQAEFAAPLPLSR